MTDQSNESGASIKPLQPLSSGIVLIVGAKASNFAEDIKSHPRVKIWDSQSQHWTNKDLPSNTRAVFMTRFVGHNEYSNVVSQARKRQISIFNPDGTGIIANQVRQLLGIDRANQSVETNQSISNEVKEMSQKDQSGKLNPLIGMIDFSKGNTENARLMLERAKELGITTTIASLAQLVSVKRRKGSRTAVPRSIQPKESKVDVSVEILDNLIKELKDMRAFLIDTVDENRKLKAKVDKFKKFFED